MEVRITFDIKLIVLAPQVEFSFWWYIYLSNYNTKKLEKL